MRFFLLPVSPHTAQMPYEESFWAAIYGQSETALLPDVSRLAGSLRLLA